VGKVTLTEQKWGGNRTGRGECGAPRGGDVLLLGGGWEKPE